MQRANGLEIPQTLEEACEIEHTALLVYDMQVGILRQLPNGEEMVERVAEVLGAAREVGLRTFFLRHLSLPKNLMGTFQLRQAMAWQRTDAPDEIEPWFLRGSDAHAITPDLAPTEAEAVFDKIGMSAFEGTPLDTALRDCGVRSFLIVGVATEIGIEPTVRHGADLGYLPIVVTDACGAGHAEAGARSLDTLRYLGDALFTTVEEVTALLQA